MKNQSNTSLPTYPSIPYSHSLPKRILDVAGALFAIPFILSLYIPLAVLIRLDSPGPVIISQIRIGRYGKRFSVYKFRTMTSREVLYEDAPKNATDARITRVGAWLRRTSMDELPQFFNVLLGDMSIVGPRPEMEFIVDTYTKAEKARHSVKPGLTGWWQIHGRKEKSLRENLDLDMYYVQHASLWLDIKIILLTPWVVITGKGAY